MNTHKKDQFVLKVLEAKKTTFAEVLLLDEAQLAELKLSRVILETINASRDSIVVPDTHTAPIVDDADVPLVGANVTVVEEPTHTPANLSKEELEVIAAKFSDKSSPQLTKKIKAELGDVAVDLDILSAVVKAQLQANKSK